MQLSAAVAMLGVPLYVLGSLVSGYYQMYKEARDAPLPVRISFVGDMMFDRYVRERADATGYDAVLEQTKPLFNKSTFLIGNLEGPITTFAPVSDYRDDGPDHYRFTFATTVAATLADYGFGSVSLSNNHIQNFGASGVAQTRDWLQANGLGMFGGPDAPYEPWRAATSVGNIAVYAYDVWHANDVEKLTRRIQSEQEAFVVVYAHWGVEYDTEPNESQRNIAHALVDAGADIIIGSHPHVVQSREIYHDRVIYYSLGNFVFDQYFNETVRCGAVVQATIQTDHTYTVRESFIELDKNGTTKPSDCMAQVPRMQSS